MGSQARMARGLLKNLASRWLSKAKSLLADEAWESSSGLQGGVHVVKADQVEEIADRKPNSKRKYASWRTYRHTLADGTGGAKLVAREVCQALVHAEPHPFSPNPVVCCFSVFPDMGLVVKVYPMFRNLITLVEVFSISACTLDPLDHLLDSLLSTVGKMLGQILVTKQTGPQGEVVSKGFTCVKRSMSHVNEMFLAITLDRTTTGPCVWRERNSRLFDDKEANNEVVWQKVKATAASLCSKVIDGLSPKVADRNVSIEQVKKLYKLFCECDYTLLEIDPIAKTSDNQLVAADAKLNFDDNVAFLQKQIFAMRDPSQEDPHEVAAAKADLNYIGLDGEIGCMVNSAGLAMATMDIIKLHGGTPANFLDVGGNASEGQLLLLLIEFPEQVVEAFKILTSNEKVKAILVNIFGGIMKYDVIASGIVALKVPVVVRLEGTNVGEGKGILKGRLNMESSMTLVTAEDLDDAAEKAVKQPTVEEIPIFLFYFRCCFFTSKYAWVGSF
ncbi:hypothetical protein LguiB_030736 [Lonicera macranthoides]